MHSQKLLIDPQKPFSQNSFLFSSFSIMFLHFHPHIQPVIFHLHFLLFSIIFINKCAKNTIASPKPQPFPLPIFFSHNNLTEHPLGFFTQNSTWNKCPSIVVIIFSFINFYYREFSLGLLQNSTPWGTPSSVFNDTYNQQYC